MRISLVLLASAGLAGLAAFAGLAACAGAGGSLPVQPLPELVAPQPAAEPIAVSELLLVPEERMMWDVHWKGLTIGRIELTVGANEVHSRFQTGKLISSVTSIQHELATVLDRTAARAHSQHETLAVDGEARTIDATFDDTGYSIDGRPAAQAAPASAAAGSRVHTLHSALGALRAWARPGAVPGFLVVLVGGEQLRLELGEPVEEALRDRPALRIAARAQGGDAPAAITIWLDAAEDRTPLRIEIANESGRMTAELIDE